MEFSPIDIKSQKFSKKIKGYDVTEVENFLEIVSDDLEKLYGEYYDLKEELVKKNQEITGYKEKDKAISEAILMVQSVSSDIKKAAIVEAEAMRKSAIVEAEKIVDNANRKYIEIANHINDLLNKRLIIMDSIKNLLSTNMDLINQEIAKNTEVSITSEQVKIDTTDNGKDDANNDTEHIKNNDNTSIPPHDKPADKSSETDNGTAYDILKNEELEGLLGDVNKFTF